jgi:hypothetical protein
MAPEIAENAKPAMLEMVAPRRMMMDTTAPDA